MKYYRLQSLCCACLLACFAGSSVLRADTPAILLSRDLQPMSVRLLAITDGRVYYTVEGDNALRDAPADQFARVILSPPASDAPADAPGRTNLFKMLGLGKDDNEPKPDASETPVPAVLELTDGQRVLGQPVASDNEDQVRWQSTDFGQIDASIDHVRAVVFESVGFAPSESADLLILANGDRLTGFVVALGPKAVAFQPDGQTRSLVLPRDRVHVVRLSNPDMPTEQRAGHMVRLRDGQRVRMRQFDIDEDTLVATPALGPADAVVRIPIKDVQRIDIASSRGRVTDLADLPRNVTAGGKVFGVTMHPRPVDDARPTALASSALWLHAPIAVTFDLPKGADRLSFNATLGDARGTPTGWADAELIVTVAGKEAARKRLTVKSPTVSVNIPAGERLEIRIESGVNGPVLDRVTLRDAVVHVATQ